MTHKELDLMDQARRLRKRIAYAEAVIQAGGTTARLKAQILPSLYRAEQKIQLGTYENCDDCGDTIGTERLQKIPGAIRCRRCQNAYEDLGPPPALS